MIKEVIAYTRRSQDKKGQKHSIKRQTDIIESFAAANQLKVIDWFSETESGMKDDRQELAKAITKAEKTGAAIIVSSVSRLGRKLSKLAQIIENPNINVICADLGMTANFLQVCIMSIFAAEERNMLAKRTKEGIAAARSKAIAEGRKFNIGNPDWEREDCLPAAWEAARAKGRATAIRLGGLIHRYREHLNMSYGQIAKELNAIGYDTPSGKGLWYAKSVIRVHKRFVQEDQNEPEYR